jgi:hypothetical protein
VSSSSLIQYWTKRGAEEAGRNVLGDNEIERVLQRLDGVMQNEARTTAAQTLQVVYGLVQNVKLVMDGKQILLGFSHAVP